MLAGIFIFFIAFVWLAIREVIQSTDFNKNEKILWVAVLFFLGYIGAGLYWYIGRKKIFGTI
ncbi:MAG: PLDc N-terminal domain-containing protein [Bacteroidota bacterium]